MLVLKANTLNCVQQCVFETVSVKEEERGSGQRVAFTGNKPLPESLPQPSIFLSHISDCSSLLEVVAVNTHYFSTLLLFDFTNLK